MFAGRKELANWANLLGQNLVKKGLTTRVALRRMSLGRARRLLIKKRRGMI